VYSFKDSFLMNLKTLLFFVLPFSLLGQITGTWNSSFIVMGMSKRINLNIEISDKDTAGWIRDPESKSAVKIPIDKLKILNDSLHFSWTAGGLTFNGRYFSIGDTLNGIFHQAGLEWNVHLTREEQELKQLLRPQEPKAPFPYKSEERLIKNGCVTLSATLTLPETDSTFPIVVLASGSGPQDRNCEIMGHKPFLVIADYLARNGIACLRFDDRGTGKSTGVFMRATLEDFASDVKACVNHVKKDQRFANSPIGIVGHSEGGMHALIAAQKNKEVSFVIELASVGTSGLEVFLTQQYQIPLKENGDTALAVWNRELFRGACVIVGAEKNAEIRTRKLNEYLDA
jgi:alpha/beta superfamily hydrolase